MTPLTTRLAVLSGRLERLSGRRLLYAPVLLGAGIGIYFSLPREPTMPAWVLLGLAALAFAWLGRRLRRSPAAGLGFADSAAAVLLAGLLVAGLRVEAMRAPVLGFRYYGPVEGRIVAIDVSQSDAVRLTLDRLRFDRIAPGERPERVRVSLHGAQDLLTPEPGQRVALTAFLSGPEGPVEPGDFDFQRFAWFKRLGAVGYTRTPVLLLAPATPGLGTLMIERLRAPMTRTVLAAIPGQAGAFAAAVTTGDRTAMARETDDALRASNLYHILSISGLHMAIVTGFVFSLMRYGLALVPGLAAKVPIHKVAAVFSLQTAAFYLALSGGGVATERSFIMIAVVFGAVLADRQAISLRSVALAALVLLVLQPEALLDPGFQMSFAATTALVVAYGGLRHWSGPRPPRLLRAPLGVLLSSFVAGMGTAPFAAAHFNQIAHYGLIANAIAVPVMGIFVMPLAVIAVLLAPFGLAPTVLALMRWPIELILATARWVAGMGGAVSQVPSPGAGVLPLLALGALALLLFHGRARLAGVATLALALALWGMNQRPTVLIAAEGGLVGVMTEAGRSLSKPRGEGFSAQAWLENDGDDTSQSQAAARPGWREDSGIWLAELGRAGRIAHIFGKGSEERAARACALAPIVVSDRDLAGFAPPPGCTLYDASRLAASGALALWPEGDGLRVRSVAETRGARPWVRN